VQAWLAQAPDAGGNQDVDAHDKAFVAGLVRPRAIWGGSNPSDPAARSMWRSRAQLAQSASQLHRIETRFAPQEGVHEA
jgi:hypothetical protein